MANTRRGGVSLWIQLCCLLLVITAYSPDQAEAAIEPSLNEDGEIVWGSLVEIPPSNLYTDFNDVEKPEGILDMAEGFADFIVNGLPYEAIREVAMDVKDDGIKDDDIASSAWSVAQGFWGVIILFSLGFLLMIFVPLIGFCFCCCRCCGKCGGKRSQLDSNLGCKRVTLSLLFLAVIAIVCAGMAFTNSANDFQGVVIKESDAAFISLSNAALNYTKDITNQIDYMVNVQYYFADQVIRNSLIDNTLGTDVTDYIKEDLELQAVIDDLSVISSNLTSVGKAYEDLNNDREFLIAIEAQLEANLTDIAAKLQTANSSCDDCLKPFDDNVYTDYSMLPIVSEEQMRRVTEGLEGVNEFSKQITNSLKEIESEVQAATNDTVVEVIIAMDSTQETVVDSFNELEDLIVQASDALTDAQTTYTGYLEDYSEYLDYRWYFFLAVTCSILLVVILMIIGITMGTICYKSGDPRDRSGTSNCGGNFLILNVFFMFLFFPILILLVCVLFTVFGLVSATCTPLRTLEFYEQTIDYNYSESGYYLGELLYNNSEYDVTVSGMLRACQADATLYNATKLYYLFDFEELNQEYKNLEESLTGLVGDVEDIKFDNVIPAGLETYLNGLVAAVGLSEFDAATYNQELDKSILVSQSYLNDYATYLDEHPDISLPEIADDLRDIQENVVDPIEARVVSMKADVTTVTSVNHSLPLNVDKTIEDLEKVNSLVATVNETAVAINITEQYITYLTDVGYSFLIQNEYQIMNEFAKCKNLWDIYDTTLLYSCGYFVNSFNALWFTIGWSVFFFLPAIILSVKLAKHYRIMQEVRQPKPKRKKNNNTQPIPEDVGLEEMNYPDNSRSDERLYPPPLPPPNGYYNQGGMVDIDNHHYQPDEEQWRYDSRGNRIAPPPYNQGTVPPAPKRTSGYEPYTYLPADPQVIVHGPTYHPGYGPQAAPGMPPPHGMSSSSQPMGNDFSDTLF